MNNLRCTPLPAIGALMLAMAVTRYHHFGDALHLPDASLAVFFLAGLLVPSAAALAVLLIEAGVIDYLAVTVAGVSDYCVSPAYGFLVPYMVSPRIARHCVFNDLEQVAAIYPASYVGGVESPGPRCRSRVSSSSTYRSCNHWALQVFNTPV